MKSLENDPRTPVREYGRHRPPVTLLPIWLWLAVAAVVAAMYYYGWSKAAEITVLMTAFYAFNQLRERMSCVYAGPGWLRRRNSIVQIDHLAQITYKYSVMHSSRAQVVYDVRLTDREGRTLVIPSSDLTEDSILDFFRRGLYKSIATGLTLDVKTRAFAIRHLLAWPASLESAAAVHARHGRKKQQPNALPPVP